MGVAFSMERRVIAMAVLLTRVVRGMVRPRRSIVWRPQFSHRRLVGRALPTLVAQVVDGHIRLMVGLPPVLAGYPPAVDGAVPVVVVAAVRVPMAEAHAPWPRERQRVP